MILPHEKLSLITPIVRGLFIAFKNNSLYPSDHPICVSSIKKVMSFISQWFLLNGLLSLKMSPDKLYICGKYIESDDDYFDQIAAYLFQRGVISISMDRDMELDELASLIRFLSHDRTYIRENGGISQNLSSLPHVQLEEVDYSSVLSNVDGEETSEEDRVWKAVLHAADTDVPGIFEAEADYLMELFRDSKRSAALLNQLYQKAIRMLVDDRIVDDFRKAVVHICRHIDLQPGEDSSAIRMSMLLVISRLHPEFIGRLFEQIVTEDPKDDFVEAVMKDFSNDAIARFLVSLLNDEGSVNERLLRLFDGIIRDTQELENVVTLSTDRILHEEGIRKDNFDSLRSSIEELFRVHPDSEFLSMMYNITLDSFTNQNVARITPTARLTPLIERCVESLEQGHYSREKTWLLLNLLRGQKNVELFGKLTKSVQECIRQNLAVKEVSLLRDIFRFFSSGIDADLREHPSASAHVQKILSTFRSDEFCTHLVSSIPEAEDRDLQIIADILMKCQKPAAASLVKHYLADTNPRRRAPLKRIMDRMRQSVVEYVQVAMRTRNPSQMKGLLVLLDEYAPDRAHSITRQILVRGNRILKGKVLETFSPRTDEECEQLFQLLLGEDMPKMKKKFAVALLRSGNRGIIGKLFAYSRKRTVSQEFLVSLIGLCGQMRTREAYPYLKQIVSNRPLIPTKRSDSVRIASASSLMRIDGEGARAVIGPCLKERRRAMRRNLQKIMNES